jgi:DNA-binding LytR/AlgR family response regulator
LRRHLPAHLLGTLAFSLAHVALMIALRKLTWTAIGQQYPVSDWLGVVLYEYLKDVRTYLLVLVAIWSYRLLMMRLQGEARLLDPTEPAAGSAPAPAASAVRPERFLVRKLRKEFLVAAADIEWLQAQGNYVGLHVRGHDYLLRSTLNDFLEQLDAARFARVHRSYAVNLDHIAEIEPLEAGDARLRMKDGSQVPCSRRYREALGR